MNRLLALVAAVIVGVFVTSSSILAHHSGAGEWSANEWKTVTGTVKEFRFTNPHPLLVIEVKNDKGQIETWSFQFHAVSKMARMFGWNRGTFKFGQTVTIKGHPYHKSPVMTPIYVTLPDGKQQAVNGSVAPNDY